MDRHAGVHVRKVDPVAKRSSGGGELGAGVHALGLAGVGGEMSDDALPAAHEIADGVGQVELALGVVRLEPVERRPEQVGPEDVDRRVALAQLELLGRRVSGLHDRLDGAVARANDPAVRAHVLRLEGEDGRGRLLPPMRLDELLEQLGRQKRRVARQHEHALRVVADDCAGGADCIAGPERPLLHRDLDVPERVAALRRGDHHEWLRAEGPSGLQHPVDHPSAEDRVQVLGHGRAHARSEPAGHHHSCECRVGHWTLRDGWGARIRTWDRGTKTRCLTAWLRPREPVRPKS